MTTIHELQELLFTWAEGTLSKEFLRSALHERGLTIQYEDERRMVCHEEDTWTPLTFTLDFTSRQIIIS